MERRHPGSTAGERALERLVQIGLRALNPFMKRALGTRAHFLFSRWFVLLEFSGRKSGRRISTPVAFFADRGALIVTTQRPWWRNVEGTGAVVATVSGRRAGRAVEILRGEDAVPAVLRGAPAWFLRLLALDDGRIARPGASYLRQSARDGRVVLVLHEADPGAPSHRARPEGTTGGQAES